MPDRMHPMPPLSFPLLTARLSLRPFTEENFDALHAMHSRPDVMRHRYEEPRTLDDSRELLDRIKPMTGLDRPSAALRLAIVIRASGELIGEASLRLSSLEHAQREIGFIVHPDHQGHGYGVEAVIVILRLGFERYGQHRIVGRCDARPAGSARLRSGSACAGRRTCGRTSSSKGQWTDELSYAMLAAEWAARAPT